jgi:hypothetical protein
MVFMNSPESAAKPDQESGGQLVEASPQPTPGDIKEQRIDAPTPLSPHIKRLKKRKDGPYYVAPDSVEPLPSGMWSDLSPVTVEKEAAAFPAIVEQSSSENVDGSRPKNAVPEAQRKFLNTGGAAGAALLAELERGL